MRPARAAHQAVSLKGCAADPDKATSQFGQRNVCLLGSLLRPVSLAFPVHGQLAEPWKG